MNNQYVLHCTQVPLDNRVSQGSKAPRALRASRALWGLLGQRGLLDNLVPPVRMGPQALKAPRATLDRLEVWVLWGRQGPRVNKALRARLGRAGHRATRGRLGQGAMWEALGCLEHREHRVRSSWLAQSTLVSLKGQRGYMTCMTRGMGW